MTEDKQIEEMVIALTESQHEFDKAWHECLHNGGKLPERENVFYAKYLVENKGYRKASAVAEDIVRMLRAAGINEFRYPIVAKIKEKYMEDKG
jgi:hypothetical protein